MQRALLYDATQTHERPDLADPVDVGLAAALARENADAVSIVRLGSGGLVPAVSRSARAPWPARVFVAGDDDYSATRDWLVGGAQARVQRKRPRAPRLPPINLSLSRSMSIEAPPGALFLKIGWRGWEDRRLISFLLSRPDLEVVAVMRRPWELDYPEYARPRDAEAAQRAWNAAQKYATRVLDPYDMPALVPSQLAQARPANFDAQLAAASYFIHVGPIEARANTLLLLQIWREIAAGAAPTPKLILAGELGAQTEDIAPLLDWCEAIQPFVRRSGPLSPDGLRSLIFYARGLLAPDFAGADAPLLRDAGALATPVFAAPNALFAGEAPSSEILGPLAGSLWSDAILRTARGAPKSGQDAAALPDWPRFARFIIDSVAG